MKIITYKCPECGATLNIEKGLDSGKCRYCGCVFAIDDENRTITYNKNIKIEKNSTHTEHYINEAEVVRAKKDISDNKLTLFIFSFLIIIVLFCGLMVLIFSFKEKKMVESGMISGGYYEDLIGEDYESVKAHFEAAGFTNIKLVDLNDAGVLFWKADKVESVSIGGDMHFNTDDYFSPDTQVVISYH